MKTLSLRPLIWVSVAFVLLNLPGLDRSPVVWIDEVTLNDPAKELAQTGILRSSVFAGFNGFERAYYWQPPGQALTMALIYRIFGLGLWQTRLPGLLLGAAVLHTLYLVSRQLLGRYRAAVIATLLLALDPKFLQSARSGRMDTQCLLLALLAVWLYLGAASQPESAKTRRTYLIAGSGLAVGLAGITHPVAISWALAIGLLLLIEGGSRRIIDLPLFGFTAGLPLAIWVLIAWLASNLDLLAIQFLAHGRSHLVQGTWPTRIAAELGRYPREYALVPLLLLTYFLGLTFTIASRQDPTAKRRILVLFWVTFLFNGFVMSKQLGFYFLHPALILSIAAGALIDQILLALATRQRLHVLASRIYITALAVNLLAGGVVGRLLSLVWQWQARDYHQVEMAVAQAVPRGSIVWGPPEVWYAVESAGSSLRLLGEPDPARHDYIVIRSGEERRMRGRARKIAEFGQPLPPVVGLRRASADYQLAIWKWDLASPQPHPGAYPRRVLSAF
jgi:4-amino-4-deoxy-L-arabinose transferase-like glycosyltransferase